VAARHGFDGVIAGNYAAAIAGVCAAITLVLGGCAGSTDSRARTELNRPDGAGAALLVLHREDMLWLERVSFGLDSATVDEYRKLGRARFLERQLAASDHRLPASISAQIDAMEISHADPAVWITDVNAQYKAINAMPDGPDKEQARKALNDRGNKLAYEAIRRELLRAIYSPSQLQEQMVWFWLNHFSVYQHKANLRWLVGDYEESAIRPHALGHFKDLVLATLEHPAMLQYLDNNQNAVGHVNENYARELMELHTLGVGSGYTQQDVQQLARMLTGSGINAGNPPRLKARVAEAVPAIDGAFEFNPARHDFGRKMLLGRTIEGERIPGSRRGRNADRRQPACARFISRKSPATSSPTIRRRARRTHGADLRAPTATSPRCCADVPVAGFRRRARRQIQGPDALRGLGGAIRLRRRPSQHVGPCSTGSTISARRLRPPDSRRLSATELNWASSGQMSRRFEIARAIGSGNAGLFDAEDGAAAGAGGFPQLSNRLYFEAVEPFLLPHTRCAEPRQFSAGMEHLSALVAGFQL
jgi:hypothetical protein